MVVFEFNDNFRI